MRCFSREEFVKLRQWCGKNYGFLEEYSSLLTCRIGTQFDPLGCCPGLVSLHEGRSSPGNRELSLSHLGAVLCLLQLLLGLPVLGQVQSCNLLSLLDLLLVGLDLLLELLGEVRHLVLVLLILLLLELKFLNPPLRLLVSLG